MSAVMMSEKPKRIPYIDFLKFIGLTGIIIAHSTPPAWLMMARNFDVPLMVIVSSLLGRASWDSLSEKGGSLSDYYTKRVKRLVFPTWLFLAIFFSLEFLFTRQGHNPKYYVASFLMTRYGIGYVWVILVYLYCALSTPIWKRCGNSPLTPLVVALLYIVYEVMFHFGIGVNNKVIESTIFYIIPYGCVLSYIGYHYMDGKYKNLLICCSLIVFLLFGYYYYVQTGSPQDVQIAKYPPRAYYLSYGISVSLLLMTFCEKNTFSIYSNPAVQFISKHSMWIYLWHILMLAVYDSIGLPGIWFIKLLVVYVFSVVAVIVVNAMLDLVESRVGLGVLKYLRG